MPKPTTTTADTFRSYLDTLQAHNCLRSPGRWYRGVGRSDYTLTPTLHRHPAKRTAAEVRAMEREIIQRFRQRGIPFLSRDLGDTWDTLFLMQHYGVPTRLLDWTESPFFAFYFAVWSARPHIDEPSRFDHDAAIWIMDPAAWNRHALKHVNYPGGALCTDDSLLAPFAPEERVEQMNAEPVALYGAHNSPRIVAQRGVFVIFGQSVTPMEDTFDSSSYPSDCLLKIVLPRQNIPEMREAIVASGISDTVVFPDLSGLSTEILKQFGFWSQ